MMWQIVALAAAVGLDNGLAAIGLGAAGMTRRHQMQTALLFAVLEGLMPLIGVIIGHGAAAVIGRNARYVGVFVLAGAGLYSLLKREPQTQEGTRGQPQFGVSVILLGIALSLDNLTVGFGLGLLQVSVGWAAIVFGAMSLGMTIAGLEIGRWLGRRVSLSADKLCGVVLLATAGILLLQ